MQLGAKVMNRFKSRLKALKSEYNTFESHHRELAEYNLPRIGRWLSSDTNKGGKKNGKIIDNTAKMALGVLSSGMMSNLTSPARPWFNLAHPDPDMQERKAVKVWNKIVMQRMNAVFTRSNLYDSLPRCYSELGLFGNAAVGVFEDEDDTIFTQTYTQGEYWIANDKKGIVNTFGREYRLTVGQVVEKYGEDKVSSSIKDQYNRGALDSWVDLCHLVEPNVGRDLTKIDSINKPFRDVVWEKSADSNVLSFKGYEEFPILVPRWDLNSGDVYASSSPGMDALGDAKQLQLHEKRSSEAVEKMVRPSMVADPTMRNKHKSQLPGGVTYSSFVNGRPGFQEAYRVDLRLNELEQKSEQIRSRIRAAYFTDLFLMLSNSDRRQITATEIEKKYEEKLLMLGPVLERLNKELLDRLVNRTFNIMWRRGEIPAPPPELHGVDMKIEYVSVLHQAQRAVGVSAVDRLMGFAANIINLNPSSRHKLNFDQTIDDYSLMLGTNPSLIRSDEEAQQLVEAEAQAQQQQQQAMMGAEAAKTIKDLSQAQGANGNALESLINQTQ